jgi:hypothetical protein
MSSTTSADDADPIPLDARTLMSLMPVRYYFMVWCAEWMCRLFVQKEKHGTLPNTY